jgi:hypothetical protein
LFLKSFKDIGASGFPVGQKDGKKPNPLTRTPESKKEWVVPHERVEVYQGPIALSRKRARDRYNPFSGRK